MLNCVKCASVQNFDVGNTSKLILWATTRSLRGTVTRTCTGNFRYAKFGDWTGPAGSLNTRTGVLVDWW